jgi:site-specific DNA recombinase
MKAPRSGSLSPVPAVTRCAIYTRQSVEERGKNGFGSLQAQREAGEKYVSLFPEKGWELVPAKYEDSGISGGTLERPALTQLRADIAAGLIDCVVVYRSDRLSRSIRDFLELMEEFDHHGVAFVSVSEQFDTSTPGGRMHRNMLLTFAQYERELIAERTRDKVWAARKKGRFTGGQLPLGYDRHPDGGKLIKTEVEAKRVRTAFRLFERHGSLVEVVQELARRGISLKRWTTKEGREVGGGAIDVHSLRRMLTNPVYIAEVHFDGGVYPAEHEPIIDRDLWDRVQGLLEHGATGPRRRSTRSTALLTGLLRCAACDCAMTPTYSAKKNRRFRYYLCVKAHRRGWKTCPAPSLPATEIERIVVDRVRAIDSDPDLVARTVEEAGRALESRKAELEAEARRQKKDLDRAHEAQRQDLEAVSGTGKPRRRASHAEAVSAIEERLAVVSDELAALSGQKIDPCELGVALAAFDPVWDRLTTPEQARVVQLLIERIDHDGRDGNLDITFRPAGVRLLATEGIQPREDGA